MAGQSPAAAHLSLSGCGPRPHLFSKFCLGDQSKETKIYYRIVHFYYFKCFRLVLKSKGNVCLFSRFVWHTDGRGAGGRRGQDLSNGNIFYDCLFLLFQMLSNSIEKQRKRKLFSNLVWERKCPQFWKCCLADVKRKYVLGLFICTV